MLAFVLAVALLNPLPTCYPLIGHDITFLGDYPNWRVYPETDVTVIANIQNSEPYTTTVSMLRPFNLPPYVQGRVVFSGDRPFALTFCEPGATPPHRIFLPIVAN